MEHTLEERAIIAYGNRAFRDHSLPRMYTGTAHRVEIDGKPYVLVSNAVDVVGMYRILTSGRLKWLKRWPAFDQSDIARRFVLAMHLA